MNVNVYDYKGALELLQSSPNNIWEEITEVLLNSPIFKLEKKSENKNFSFIQQLSNTYFQKMYSDNFLWESQVDFSCFNIHSGDVVDFYKSFSDVNVIMEVQFGNNARSDSDLEKFMRAHGNQIADVCVHILPMRRLATEIDSGIADFERVVQKLEYSKMYNRVPILVLGIDYDENTEVVDLDNLPNHFSLPEDPRDLIRGTGAKQRQEAFVCEYIDSRIEQLQFC